MIYLRAWLPLGGSPLLYVKIMTCPSKLFLWGRLILQCHVFLLWPLGEIIKSWVS